MNIITSSFICCFLFLINNCFKLDTSHNFIIDSHGRYKLFHGVNVVVKIPPYIPNTNTFDPYFSFTDKDIQILKNLGMNLVRLGIIWESIEKEEGKYDYEHLDKMAEIVNKLEKEGIAVIIDAHQDIFSRNFCGEGVPTFYAEKLTVDTKCNKTFLSKLFKLLTACIPLEKYKWNRDENGLPLLTDCKLKGSFMDYHRSPELYSIYDSFFKNEHGVLNKFIKFWEILAQKFSNKSNVLGYDIWNEPWAPGLWSDISNLIPGYVDDHYLSPFYTKVDSSISKLHKDYILFYQSIPFPDTLPLFGGRILSSFSKPPVNIQKRPQVFNVHSYCCMAGPNVCRTESGEPKLTDAKGFCKDFHNRKIRDNKKQAQQLNAPLIITEFGACGGSEACYNEMLGLELAADKYLVSWTYWMYKPFGDPTTTAANNTEGIFEADGNVQVYKEKAMSRSYVLSYQGIPMDLEFNDETKEMKTSFRYFKNITVPNEIYLNKKLNYPNGYEVFVKNEVGDVIVAKIWEDEINSNYVYVDIGKVEDGKIVSIVIEQK